MHKSEHTQKKGTTGTLEQFTTNSLPIVGLQTEAVTISTKFTRQYNKILTNKKIVYVHSTKKEYYDL
jgi:hypothetical protein